MLTLLRRISRPVFPFLSPTLLHRTRTTASSSYPVAAPPVAVFWDLDNKPPNTTPPYDAAVRLRLALSSLGPLRFAVAYANSHTFRHVPAPVRSARAASRAFDRLEDSGRVPPPSEPYTCRICGRNFYIHSKFLNHFKIHEREHTKRLRRLDSATGSRYVRLKAQLNFKMEKYRKVARDILVPRVGFGLREELQRAGVSVRVVGDLPEAADRALREHMVETMDRGKIGCLVLISDDTGFVGVVREARMRCLKTVVIGDDENGSLKRCADASFSWKDVISGKARKEAASAVLKWKDKDLLKKLEWTYRPELESKASECNGSGLFDVVSEGGESLDDECEDFVRKGDPEPWWKLD